MKKPNRHMGMTHTICSHKLVAKTRSGTRIIRRSENGSWTYKCYAEGKQRYFPLGYDKKEALILADKIRAAKALYPLKDVIQMYDKKRFHAEKDPTPTIKDVEERLKENRVLLGLAEKTIKDYMDNLKRVVRVMLNTKDVDDFDCGDLNESFINGYKVLALQGIKDEGKIQSRKRTINSKIRSMKAIFNHKNIFDGFCIDFNEDIQEVDFYTKLGTDYVLPPMSLIQDTFDLWHTTDGDVHTALGLSLIFGLRRSEIFHSRRDWFDTTGTKARVRIAAEKKFRPKGGHQGHSMGDKSVTKRILNKASGDDYLIKNRADSGRPVFEDVLEQLRGIGWDRQSPLHELRKLFGSYVSTTESLYTSQKWCRHADSSTTDKFYSDLIEDKKILKLWAA